MFFLNWRSYMYIYQRLKDTREDSDKKQEDFRYYRTAISALWKRETRNADASFCGLGKVLQHFFGLSCGTHWHAKEAQMIQIKKDRESEDFPNSLSFYFGHFILTPKESPHFGQAQRCSPRIRGKRICAVSYSSPEEESFEVKESGIWRYICCRRNRNMGYIAPNGSEYGKIMW